MNRGLIDQIQRLVSIRQHLTHSLIGNDVLGKFVMPIFNVLALRYNIVPSPESIASGRIENLVDAQEGGQHYSQIIPCQYIKISQRQFDSLGTSQFSDGWYLGHRESL